MLVSSVAVSLGVHNTTHQCGTVVFGNDPRTSVLDTFCRSHDVENLFVVDGSAFTTAAKAVPSLLYNGIRHPVAAANAATATAASVYRTVRPVNRTGSPLMEQRSLVRRLGVHDVPMPQLREAAHRCGIEHS